MKGIVQKIEEKHAKNGQKYLLLSIDGQNYSLWDGKVFDRIHEGERIEYKWKDALPGRTHPAAGLHIAADQLALCSRPYGRKSAGQTT